VGKHFFVARRAEDDFCSVHRIYVYLMYLNIIMYLVYLVYLRKIHKNQDTHPTRLVYLDLWVNSTTRRRVS
jgi:hypothetical protein